jgi:hypothetical protein
MNLGPHSRIESQTDMTHLLPYSNVSWPAMATDPYHRDAHAAQRGGQDSHPAWVLNMAVETARLEREFEILTHQQHMLSRQQEQLTTDEQRLQKEWNQFRLERDEFEQYRFRVSCELQADREAITEEQFQIYMERQALTQARGDTSADAPTATAEPGAPAEPETATRGRPASGEPREAAEHAPRGTRPKEWIDPAIVSMGRAMSRLALNRHH